MKGDVLMRKVSSPEHEHVKESIELMRDDLIVRQVSSVAME